MSKEATCAAAGERAYKCVTCGEIITTEPTEKAEHSPGEWKVTKKATLLTLGEKKSVCTVCGAAETKMTWNLWSIPIMIVISIVVVIGLVNYIRAYIDSQYYY